MWFYGFFVTLKVELRRQWMENDAYWIHFNILQNDINSCPNDVYIQWKCKWMKEEIIGNFLRNCRINHNFYPRNIKIIDSIAAHWRKSNTFFHKFHVCSFIVRKWIIFPNNNNNVCSSLITTCKNYIDIVWVTFEIKNFLTYFENYFLQ